MKAGRFSLCLMPSQKNDQFSSRRRALLLRRIDELTIGGEIDMDYDDDFADRAQVAGEVGENLTLANALGVQLRLVEKALGAHGRRHLWHVRSLHGTNRGRTPQHPAHDKSLHRPRLKCGSTGGGSEFRLLSRANAALTSCCRPSRCRSRRRVIPHPSSR